jgi:hypothetical protein
MIVPKHVYSHSAITRVFAGQEEKYPTTKAKLEHSRKCLAVCVQNNWRTSMVLWGETVVALENAIFAETVHFQA